MNEEILSKEEVLLYAAKIVEERGWTRNTLARTEYGDAVGPNSEHAVTWCAQGAVIRATYELSEGRINAFHHLPQTILNSMNRSMGQQVQRTVTGLNDSVFEDSSQVADLLRDMAERSKKWKTRSS